MECSSNTYCRNSFPLGKGGVDWGAWVGWKDSIEKYIISTTNIRTYVGVYDTVPKCVDYDGRKGLGREDYMSCIYYIDKEEKKSHQMLSDFLIDVYGKMRVNKWKVI